MSVAIDIISILLLLWVTRLLYLTAVRISSFEDRMSTRIETRIESALSRLSDRVWRPNPDGPQDEVDVEEDVTYIEDLLNLMSEPDAAELSPDAADAPSLRERGIDRSNDRESFGR